jgi:hypothetical protein
MSNRNVEYSFRGGCRAAHPANAAPIQIHIEAGFGPRSRNRPAALAVLRSFPAAMEME